MYKEDISFDDNDELEEGHDDDTDVTGPFATKDIKVSIQTIALSSLIKRLEYDEIDLQPSFQRQGNLWNNTQMSRLIESILLKMPLPIFYFDVSDPDKWLIVDGLQRLSAIKKFAVSKKLKLINLEFLTEFNRKGFDNLSRPMQRTIEETQIVTYQIEPQTPKEVRYSIFNRINTGGLKLNAQEIRQAINQKGIAVEFLKDTCESKEFQKIVKFKTSRMLDRELALRFFAFRLLPVDKNFKSLSTFLDRAIEYIDEFNQVTAELVQLQDQFKSALKLSAKLLGPEHRFSRAIAFGGPKILNRSLFDVLVVCLSEVEESNKLIKHKSIFKKKLIAMIEDEESLFGQAISQGTSSKRAAVNRFKQMRKLINQIESM